MCKDGVLQAVNYCGNIDFVNSTAKLGVVHIH